MNPQEELLNLVSSVLLLSGQVLIGQIRKLDQEHSNLLSQAHELLPQVQELRNRLAGACRFLDPKGQCNRNDRIAEAWFEQIVALSKRAKSNLATSDKGQEQPKDEPIPF